MLRLGGKQAEEGPSNGPSFYKTRKTAMES